MIPARRCAALFFLMLAGPAAAQAPRVTPSGDPSVRNDSLYALAAKPAEYAKYPDENAIFILDDGIISIEQDGRRTRTYRQVIQVLHEDALDELQERSFSWSPGRETFRLNWIRIVGADGKVISEGAAQSQESDVPAEFGDPVYSDEKVLRVSLAGGVVGAMVDYSVTFIENKAPEVPGDVYDWWGVSTGLSVRRSRYIVEAPSTMKLNLWERNLRFSRQTRESGGRTTYTWATGDMGRIRPQSFAADSNDVYQSVAIGGPVSWAEIGRWYGGLARDRYRLSPEAAQAAANAVAGARTRRDTVVALHKWVAQEIRYVSVALGEGGYRPRTPDEVVSTGFGDCKDKATLFVAALRSWDIPAATVLLASAGGVERSLPSVRQFDHAIAGIDLPEGRVFADLTVAFLPLGTQPASQEGKFGLLVRQDGSSEEVTFPIVSPQGNEERTLLRGEIDADGRFKGWMDYTVTGAPSWDLRSTMSTPFDSTDRATLTREMASKFYAGTRGDSLQLFDGKDLSVPAHIRFHISGGRAAKPSGPTWVLPHPMGSMASVATLAEQLDSEGERIFNIDAAAIHGLTRKVEEYVVDLPEGWKPHLPADVVQEGDFGRYSTTYRFSGRRLSVKRVTEGRRGVLPPDRIDDLRQWLLGIAADDATFLTIEGPPQAAR
jgi:transglutaminase-like putative cysteine protease